MQRLAIVGQGLPPNPTEAIKWHLIAKAGEKWELYHIAALDGGCRPSSSMSGIYGGGALTVGERWKLMSVSENCGQM